MSIQKPKLSINIDNNDKNADWIKTRTWDLPETVEGMRSALGDNWREKIETLPAWEAAPPTLRNMHEGVKSSSTYFEVKRQRYVRDPAYWGVPYGTLIALGMKPIGPTSPAGRAQRIASGESVSKPTVQIRKPADREEDIAYDGDQGVLPGMPSVDEGPERDKERLDRFRENDSRDDARIGSRRMQTLIDKYNLWSFDSSEDSEADRATRKLYDEFGIDTEGYGEGDPVVSGGDWAMFGACRDIRESAYDLLGYDRWDIEADPYLHGGDPGWGGAGISATNPDALAYNILEKLRDGDRTEFPIYRGVSGDYIDADDFVRDLQEDDTFDLPIASFTGEEESARRFGTGVVFKLEAGARYIQGGSMGVPESVLEQMQEQSAEPIYEEDLWDDPKYSEIVTGGRFKILKIEKQGVTITVTIRQEAVFNPDSGRAQKAINRRWKYAYLFDNSLQSMMVDGEPDMKKSPLDELTVLLQRLQETFGSGGEEKTQRYVRDPDYWGMPYGTPITPGMVAARSIQRRVSNARRSVRVSPRDKFDPLKSGKPREYKTDDASMMSNLPEEMQEKLREKLLEEYGLTEEDMYDNLVALYERAQGSGAVESGVRWYEDGGNYIAAYGLSYGFTREQSTAALAASSPLREWEDNVALTQYIMDVVAEDPEIPDMQRPLTKSVIDENRKMKKKTRPTYDWVAETFADKGLGKPEDVIGKRFSEIEPEQQAVLIRLLSQAGYFTEDGEKLSYPTLNKKGEPVRKFVGWSSGDVHTEKAIAILRAKPNDIAETIDSELQGMKVRSFFNNLSFGSKEPPVKRPDITMDTHAMSAATNQKYSDKSREKAVFFKGPPSSAKYGFRGFYPIFADVYRRVAEESGLEPHHFQALIWLQWRHEQDGMQINVHSALDGGK